MKKPSQLETMFQFDCITRGLEHATEYRFDPDRRWRFDFAFIPQKIAVECEGGTWMNGRHNRGYGIEKDMEKYNRAVMLGWKVLRFSKKMIQDRTAINMVLELLAKGDSVK